MNYTDARYSMFWGYGGAGLPHWITNAGVAQLAVDQLLAAFDSKDELVTKAMLYGASREIKATRKAKYRGKTSIRDVLVSKVNGCKECGIYVFDEGFTPTQAPKVILNFHTSACDGIAGRILLMPDGVTRAQSFLLFAVASDAIATDHFTTLAGAGCRTLGLGYAHIFRDVAYEYDGLTPLEWAYRNHSARLRSGRLADLVPSQGTALPLPVCGATERLTE